MDTSSVRSKNTFRKLAATELAALADQLKSASLPHENLAAPHRQYFCLTDQHRQVLGYSGLEHFGETALLRSVVVPLALRGHGHGVDLVERTLNEAKRLGVRNVYLLTTTAAEFFARLEFKSLTREQAPESIRASEEYLLQCPVSASLMVRYLR